METYFQNAPCLLFSCNDNGILLEVNERLCTELNYSREDLLTKNIEIILTVASRIFQQTHFFPLLKMHGHAEEIYVTLLTKDNKHIPVLFNTEIKIVEGKVVITYAGIIVHNRKKYEEELIAARKTAENALLQNTDLIQAKQQLQQHLEQLDHQIHLVSKQNDELRQFNRVVTHDIQEPLRKLFVFTSRKLQTDDDDKDREFVKKLVLLAEQMRTIVSGLQHYVWLTEATINISEVDVEKLLPSIIEELQKESQDVIINIETETLVPLTADPEQITVLLRELISNAVRFRSTNNEARIKITSTSLMLNKFRHVKDKYQFSEFVKLEIKDEGIGFNPEYKEQVFQLFRRLHKESGRGVGLALCRKIIDNHKGEIKIDSNLNKGTSITILLPIHQPEKA